MVAAFSAGQNLTAADLLRILKFGPIKQLDESWNSASGGGGTTLQNDNELLIAGAANTNYEILFCLKVVEAAGTGIDMKCAWTQPTGCILDLNGVAPHELWASAAALEVEWAAWQNETSTTTSTHKYGTNTVTFSYFFAGSWRVGSTAGNLQFQWAQQNASASNLTVKAGSSLFATPVLA